MIMEDVFDVCLKVVFVVVVKLFEEDKSVDVFVQSVIVKFNNLDCKWVLILGGVGFIGLVIVGMQFESVLGNIQILAEGIMVNVFFLMLLEIMVVVVMVFVVGMVVLVLFCWIF